MPELSTLTDIRDVVIIVFGILGLVALALTILFTVLIGWGVLKLIRVSRSTMRDGVGPALENAQETVKGVRGTAEFVALWFKQSGMESAFYIYVSVMIAISLTVYVRMRDTKAHSRILED